MKKLSRALIILRDEGFRSLFSRVKNRFTKSPDAPSNFWNLPVKQSDALAADWTNPPEQLLSSISVESGPVTIAWIMSPPSVSSGGHQNLFRFIDFAEKAGHKCLIYFYTNSSVVVNSSDMKRMLRDSGSYPDLKAEMSMYDSKFGVQADVQAIFATSWETAYPVFLDRSNAKRFYFVQDFEPDFYSKGSHAIFAENTYRFGFHGITAGGWLSKKLGDEYGMRADHFDFAANRDIYSAHNRSARREVIFYARPSTPRRGFELGLLALGEVSRQRPHAIINLAGESLQNVDIPFPHNNLQNLSLKELNDVYNRCVAGLVISATNMSLLPLELIAAGVSPVVNDAPNNRLVSDNKFIEYVEATPAAIARRIISLLDRDYSTERLNEMLDSLSQGSWQNAGEQFLNAFEGAMRE